VAVRSPPRHDLLTATEIDPTPGDAGLSASAPGAAFLSALQLSDSFFPTGRYTLSHGFEAFVQAGLASKANLEALLRDYLEHVLGPSDGVALSHAHRAVEAQDLARLLEIDRRLGALKLVREAREASGRVGRRILATAVTLTPHRLLADYRAAADGAAAPGNAAVALGAVAAALRVPRREALLMELYTFCASLLGAAMRLIRLDHEEAQGILARLKPPMARVAQENLDKALDEMRAFAPLIDLMGMAHERASIRLFIS
jgi:urease accessory protein